MDKANLVGKLMDIQEACNQEIAAYPMGNDVIGLAELILEIIKEQR